MTTNDLRRLLNEGFTATPRPTPDEIVSHSCCECFRIRDDFSPHAWPDVPGEVFEYHWDSFPLFTPQALRYYLPGYMLHALKNPGSEVAGWVIEKLRDLGQPDEFWAPRASSFAETEKAAIREFLHFVYESPDFTRLRADSYDALVCWGENPNPAVEGDARKSSARSSR